MHLEMPTYNAATTSSPSPFTWIPRRSVTTATHAACQKVKAKDLQSAHDEHTKNFLTAYVHVHERTSVTPSILARSSLAHAMPTSSVVRALSPTKTLPRKEESLFLAAPKAFLCRTKDHISPSSIK